MNYSKNINRLFALEIVVIFLIFIQNSLDFFYSNAQTTILPAENTITWTQIGPGGGVFKIIDSSIVEFKRFMNKGWNLISIPIQLANTSINEFLKSIYGKYESVWTFDTNNKNWKQLNVNLPDWANDLYTIEPEKGYWVNMLYESTLIVTEKLINNLAIDLVEGWNLVGYNDIISRPIEIALLSIHESFDSVWSYDQEYKVYSKNKHLDNLKTMDPGNGYWIKTFNKCKWYLTK